MRIAFHAPLKPPDHPRPSGDRTMARLLMQALRAGGHDVFLASRLRIREARGDAAAQARLRVLAQQEATMLSARLVEDPPDLWFTYHVYYKAPDLIGPTVSRALGIPYVAAEASHAGKRMKGPHAGFARDALAAIQHADALICMTAQDRHGLSDIAPDSRLHSLKPFLNIHPRPRHHARPGPMRLLTVAMMRQGDKLHSYRLLANSLARLKSGTWQLTIVGGGEAERDVRNLFARFSNKVQFTGILSGARLDHAFASHDLFVWPAVNEAYGLSLLQASAHGLPVIAGDEGGVGDVIMHRRNGLLVPRRDPHRLARALHRLISDRSLFTRLQAGSWRRVERVHRMYAASAALNRILVDLCRS